MALDPDRPIAKTPPSDETSVTSPSFGTLPQFSDISPRTCVLMRGRRAGRPFRLPPASERVSRERVVVLQPYDFQRQVLVVRSHSNPLLA